MTAWTATTLVGTDDAYDRDRASDGHSRLGAYLADCLDRFHEYGEPDTPLTAEEFAAAVWEVATSPTMSPGYVRTRPDLGHVRLAFAEDGSSLGARVAVPCRTAPSVRACRTPGGAGRPTATAWPTRGRTGSSWPRPTTARRLVTAELSAPLTGCELHTPRSTRGHGLVADAKRALRLLVRHVNTHAGPMVATVHGQEVST